VARVLVVEDSADVGDAVRMILETGGHDVRLAPTVAAAVAACEDAARDGWRIDLMLLDLTLPDGDGLDVVAAAARGDALPGRIVAVTGWDDVAIVARCRAAGCHDVLLKPIPARQLLALCMTIGS
jgi:DNA-binding response OmpR family regulator